MKSDRLSDMMRAVKRVSQERGWEKHHTPKNLAMDLVREASEALEHFVWATNGEIKTDKKRIKKIQAELGDVLHAMLLLVDVLKIDLPKSFWQKLEKVKQRYPIDQVYGKTGYEYKNRKG